MGSSLSAYYEQVNADGLERINVLGPIVVVCGVATIVLLICTWMRRNEAAIDAKRVGPSKAITKTKIAQFFPSLPMTTTCDEPTCVVCLSTIVTEQEYRKLQCSHYFHTECIDSWWLYKPRVELDCPMCKRTQNLKEQQDLEDQPDLEKQQETSARPQPEVGH